MLEQVWPSLVVVSVLMIMAHSVKMIQSLTSSDTILSVRASLSAVMVSISSFTLYNNKQQTIFNVLLSIYAQLAHLI